MSTVNIFLKNVDIFQKVVYNSYMHIIKQFIICRFFKFKKAQDVLGELQVGNYVRYLNGDVDLKFIITHINKDQNEIIARTILKQGYAAPNSISIRTRKDVYSYLINHKKFKVVSIEEEQISGTKLDYPYTNFKVTISVCPEASCYLEKSKNIEKSLLLFF